MNLEMSEEQNLPKAAFARVCGAWSFPARARAVEPHGFDAALWRGLAVRDTPESIVRRPEGLGYLERDHRRSTATTIHAGASEILRSISAERALGRPRNR